MSDGSKEDKKARKVSGRHDVEAGNGDSRSALAPASADGQAAELDRYLDHLAQLDMPLAMKIELIRALRVIMQTFVDRAFGDDPVQICSDRLNISSKRDASAPDNMLKSSFSRNVNR